MHLGFSRGARAIACALVVAAISLSAAPVGANVAENKTYTIDVRGDAVAPDEGDLYAGDADAVVTVTLRNTSPNQQLGSADVVVPAPLVVVAASDDAVVGGPVIELRDLGLPPGASATFTVTVDVQTCVATTPAPFEVAAKQSNDFNGTGNDFFLEASSDLQVDVVGNCSLAFVGQPTDAERDEAITTVPFDPAGAPITVEVLDANPNPPAERATHSAAEVSLAAVNPAVPAPVLGGTTTAAAVSGLASFVPGPTLGISAAGYRLVATSPGLADAVPSTAFAIVDDEVNCPAGQPCTETARAEKSGASLTADFGTGASGTNLLVSIDSADVPDFECDAYPRDPGLLVSQFSFSGDLGGDRTGTTTTVIPDASRPLNTYEVCWAAPYPFTTDSGAVAEVQGTKPGTDDPLYVGVLPDCAKGKGKPQILPCVSDRSFDKKTSTASLSVASSGEDPWRY